METTGSAVTMGEDKINGEICAAFGLEHVISLDLHIAAGEVNTLTVKMYAGEFSLENLIPIIKRFELVEK